jgi:uncharacterized protein
MWLRIIVFFSLLLPIAAAAATPDVQASTYQADFAKWRQNLETARREKWIRLVGLFWLRDGDNRVGSDQHDDVPLPEGKAPAQVGIVSFHSGKASFTAAPSVSVTNEGKRVETIELQPDIAGKATVLQIGPLQMHLIQRGQRFGIRVKDTSKAGDFKEPDFYPLTSSYVVEATFIPYPQTKKVAIPTVLGTDAMMDSPGELEFTLNGRVMRIQAVLDEPPQLMLIIKDQTSGKTTYPAGRFIDTAAPKDGKVVIDFNRAYNPPCAFTAYATCPMPPHQNWLPTAVEAGEKYSGHH